MREDDRSLVARVIREEFSSKNIEVKNIILFGSRARGDSKPNSDWDLLVCIDKEISFPEKALITTKIQTRLAEKLLDVEIIVKSEAKLKQEKGNVGAITYYVLKEGVPV